MAKKIKIEIGKVYWLYGEYPVTVKSLADKEEKLYAVTFNTKEGKAYFNGDELIVNYYSLLEEKQEHQALEDFKII